MDGLCRVEGGLWVGWACASYWTDLWVEGLLWEDSIEPMYANTILDHGRSSSAS